MRLLDKIIKIKTDDLIPYHNNPKEHPPEQVDKIASSIKNYGFTQPIVIDGDNEIIIGHGRLEAARKLGLEKVPCIQRDDLTDNQIKALRLADNKVAQSAWNMEALETELELIDGEEFTGFDEDDFEAFGFNEEQKQQEAHNSLQEQFLVPPFSVLDARQGYWQDRKNYWLDLGIKSEEGRVAEAYAIDRDKWEEKKNPHANPDTKDGGCGDFGENYKKKSNLLGFSKTCLDATPSLSGTSVFDPVLTELAYRWFCIPGGRIFDPFAGGSVRGVIADYLDYEYIGIELREIQVKANRKNAKEIGVNPTWYCDDSLNADDYLEDESVDFVFSCPPYADLEVYSEDERDISNMEYDEFLEVYRQIIQKSYNKLKDNSFACFVVGEVRDEKGQYYNFVPDTIKAFKDAGFEYYNEAILVTALGSLPIRTPRMFKASRKLGKTHQNVLVFYKGDTNAIKEKFKDSVQHKE